MAATSGGRIRVWHPQSGTQRIPVGTQEITIGRTGGDARVQVDGDRRLSRRHGRVWADDRGIWYEDLGSPFGSWVDAQRLRSPVLLTPGLFVVLSETLVSVEYSPGTDPDIGVPAGMTLHMEARPGAEGLVEALGNSSPLYVSVLYDIVNRLLLSSSVELISDALGRLRQVVPAAQRLHLVAWPPGPDGRFESLVASEPMPSISTSLVRYAVEHKRALWLSGSQPPEDLEAGPSVLAMGIQSAVYVPLVDPSGEVPGLLCVDSANPTQPLTADHFQFVCAIGGLLASALAMDRLRRYALEQKLEAEAVKARRESLVSFLQIGSHDLKNQLTAILNTALFLQEYTDPKKQRRLLELLLKASNRATDLIATYLDVSQMEADRPLQVTWTTLNPRPVVDEEIAVLKLAFPGRTERLVFNNGVRGEPIRTDNRKLRQILANLIGNAILYSPEGGEVSVTTEEVDGTVQFHVRDQGVGITPEDQKRLFSAFGRVGDVRQASGTGLGLWLSAALVAALGGRMWVDSEVGRGSVFSFSLPQ